MSNPGQVSQEKFTAVKAQLPALAETAMTDHGWNQLRKEAIDQHIDLT